MQFLAFMEQEEPHRHFSEIAHCVQDVPRHDNLCKNRSWEFLQIQTFFDMNIEENTNEDTPIKCSFSLQIYSNSQIKWNQNSHRLKDSQTLKE